jgi:hypothetical protein
MMDAFTIQIVLQIYIATMAFVRFHSLILGLIPPIQTSLKHQIFQTHLTTLVPNSVNLAKHHSIVKVLQAASITPVSIIAFPAL